MKIRLIGCGSMGSAIAHTLAEHGKEVSLYDKYPERAESLARAIRVPTCKTPLENFTPHDILLLAVKPQDFPTIAEELKEIDGGLVASIMTGISIAHLKHAFPHCKVLRTMPNLAVRYGDGIVALAEDPELDPFHKQIEEAFSPLGMLRWIPERLFDGVTALTGSGPAFVFVLIEAMVDAAIEMGFSSQMGYDLVKQMVGGTLTTLYESQEEPCELRWKVASPGGTTSAGIRCMEEHGIRSALIESFVASAIRSQELGEG